MTHIVLVGAGHAHVEVLRRFARVPPRGARVTLVTRTPLTPYSGMLPGLIAGHYRPGQAHIAVLPLASAARAGLVLDEAIALDLAARRLRLAASPSVPFDLLSLDIGSAPSPVPGAAGSVIPVKPIDGFTARFEALLDEAVGRPGRMRIAVVGTGAAGVELSLAVQHRMYATLRARGRARDVPEIGLFGRAPRILPGFNAGTARRFERILAERRIAVASGASVRHVEGRTLHLADGMSHTFDAILWTTQASAAEWLGSAGLAVDAEGFVQVDDCLRSVSHPFVFAAGDVASMVDHKRPKSGVFAVRQGPPLAGNLRAVAEGRAARPFIPQRKVLSLISTGDRYAVASRGSWSTEGAWVWRWKDWIDRRWMSRYKSLEG